MSLVVVLAIGEAIPVMWSHQGPLGGCVVTGDFETSVLDETLAEFCN